MPAGQAIREDLLAQVLVHALPERQVLEARGRRRDLRIAPRCGRVGHPLQSLLVPTKVGPRSAVSSSQSTVSGVARLGKEERWRGSPAGCSCTPIQIERGEGSGCRCAEAWSWSLLWWVRSSQPRERMPSTTSQQKVTSVAIATPAKASDYGWNQQGVHGRVGRRQGGGREAHAGHERRLRQHRERAAPARRSKKPGLLIAHA